MDNDHERNIIKEPLFTNEQNELIEEAIVLEKQGQFMKANTIYQTLQKQFSNKQKHNTLNEKISRNLKYLRINLQEKMKNQNRQGVDLYKKEEKTSQNSLTTQDTQQNINIIEENQPEKKITFQILFNGEVGNVEVTIENQNDNQNNNTNDNDNTLYSYKDAFNQKIYFSKDLILNQFKKTTELKILQAKTANIIDENMIKKDENYFQKMIPVLFQRLLDIRQLSSKDSPQQDDEILEDNDATEYLEDNYQVAIPTLFKQDFYESWKQLNQYYMEVYSRDPSILINHCIYSNTKVQVYQCLDTKNNSLKIFKQLYNKKEYQDEKNMYLKLMQSEDSLQEFLFLKDLQFDDEFNILVMNKAECDLLDYMKMKYQLFQEKAKYQDKKNIFHLEKAEFLSLLKFMVEASIEFEQIGIYLQDNKPENILMQKIYDGGSFYLQPVFTDFGSVFQTDQSDCTIYPSYGTQFYFDQKLYKMKNEKISPYSQNDIIYNELYCIVRSLQACLFPVKYSENDELSQQNIDKFIELVGNQYGLEVAYMLGKMINGNYQERYSSFEDLLSDISGYEEKNPQICIDSDCFFDNLDKNIQEFKNEQKFIFFNKYFHKLISQNDIQIEEMEEILKFLDKHALNEQGELLITLFIDFEGEDLHFNDTVLLLKQKAKMVKQSGNIQKSLQQNQEILNILNLHWGENHIESAATIDDIGILYRDLGDLQKAKEMHGKCLDIQTKQFGEGDIESAHPLLNLGVVHHKSGDLQKAEELYQKSLSIFNRHYGKNHVESTKVLANIALIYKNKNQFDLAEKIYKKCLQIKNDYYGEDHIETAKNLLNLGNVYKNRKNYEEAMELLEKCLKIVSNHFGNEHFEAAKVLLNLGNLYKELREFEKAEEMYERSLNIKQIHFGKYHPETEKNLNNLANLYRDMGEQEKAVVIEEQCLKIEKNIQNS